MKNTLDEVECIPTLGGLQNVRWELTGDRI